MTRKSTLANDAELLVEMVFTLLTSDYDEQLLELATTTPTTLRGKFFQVVDSFSHYYDERGDSEFAQKLRMSLATWKDGLRRQGVSEDEIKNELHYLTSEHLGIAEPLIVVTAVQEPSYKAQPQPSTYPDQSQLRRHASQVLSSHHQQQARSTPPTNPLNQEMQRELKPKTEVTQGTANQIFDAAAEMRRSEKIESTTVQQVKQGISVAPDAAVSRGVFANKAAYASDGGVAVVINEASLHPQWTPPQLSLQAESSIFRSNASKEIVNLLQQYRRVVIHGIPGVGKTEVARQVARQYRESHYQDGIIFVEDVSNKLHRPDFIDELLNEWASYVYPGQTNRLQCSPALIRSLLGKHSHLLVILDNVWAEDMQERIKPILAALPDEVHLLITSSSVSTSSLSIRAYELREFNLEEALELAHLILPQAFNREAPPSWLFELFKLLDYHPQALATDLNLLSHHGEQEWENLVARLMHDIQHGTSNITSPLHSIDEVKRVNDSILRSYRELTEVAQARFRALGLLAPGADFSIWDAVRLWNCEEGEARRQLNELVVHSLLSRSSHSGPKELWRQNSVLRKCALELVKAGKTVEFDTYLEHSLNVYHHLIEQTNQHEAEQIIQALPQIRHIITEVIEYKLPQALNLLDLWSNKFYQFGLSPTFCQWAELAFTNLPPHASPILVAQAAILFALALQRSAAVQSNKDVSQLERAQARCDHFFSLCQNGEYKQVAGSIYGLRAILFHQRAISDPTQTAAYLPQAIELTEIATNLLADSDELYGAVQFAKTLAIWLQANQTQRAEVKIMLDILQTCEENLAYQQYGQPNYSYIQAIRSLMLLQISSAESANLKVYTEQALVYALEACEALEPNPKAAPLIYSFSQLIRAMVLTQHCVFSKPESHVSLLEQAVAASTQVTENVEPSTSAVIYAWGLALRVNAQLIIMQLEDQKRDPWLERMMTDLDYSLGLFKSAEEADGLAMAYWLRAQARAHYMVPINEAEALQQIDLALDDCAAGLALLDVQHDVSRYSQMLLTQIDLMWDRAKLTKTEKQAKIIEILDYLEGISNQTQVMEQAMIATHLLVAKVYLTYELALLGKVQPDLIRSALTLATDIREQLKTEAPIQYQIILLAICAAAPFQLLEEEDEEPLQLLYQACEPSWMLWQIFHKLGLQEQIENVSTLLHLIRSAFGNEFNIYWEICTGQPVPDWLNQEHPMQTQMSIVILSLRYRSLYREAEAQFNSNAWRSVVQVGEELISQPIGDLEETLEVTYDDICAAVAGAYIWLGLYMINEDDLERVNGVFERARELRPVETSPSDHALILYVYGLGMTQLAPRSGKPAKVLLDSARQAQNNALELMQQVLVHYQAHVDEKDFLQTLSHRFDIQRALAQLSPQGQRQQLLKIVSECEAMLSDREVKLESNGSYSLTQATEFDPAILLYELANTYYELSFMLDEEHPTRIHQAFNLLWSTQSTTVDDDLRQSCAALLQTIRSEQSNIFSKLWNGLDAGECPEWLLHVPAIIQEQIYDHAYERFFFSRLYLQEDNQNVSDWFQAVKAGEVLLTLANNHATLTDYAELHLDVAATYLGLGDAYRESHQWQSTLEASARAIELAPNDEWAQLLRIRALINLGRFEEATQELNVSRSKDAQAIWIEDCAAELDKARLISPIDSYNLKVVSSKEITNIHGGARSQLGQDILASLASLFELHLLDSAGKQPLIVIGANQDLPIPLKWVSPTLPRGSGALPIHAQTQQAIEQSLRSGTNVIILYGEQGVGKSQLAINLARHLEAKYPGGILHAKLNEQVHSEIDLLPILNQWSAYAYGGKILPGYQCNVSKVCQLLSGHGPLLAILDGVDTETPIATLLAALPDETSVLITTRSMSLTLGQATYYTTYEVKPIVLQDGIRLIHHRLQIGAEGTIPESWISKLVELSTGNPFALSFIVSVLQRMMQSVDATNALETLKKVITDPLPTGGSTLVSRLSQLFHFCYTHILDHNAQRRFYQLGAFASDSTFTSRAVMTLWDCSESETQTQLQLFQDLALINEESGVNPDRWRFHPMLQQYAQEILNAHGEQAAALVRLVAFYQDPGNINIDIDRAQLMHLLICSLNQGDIACALNLIQCVQDSPYEYITASQMAPLCEQVFHLAQTVANPEIVSEASWRLAHALYLTAKLPENKAGFQLKRALMLYDESVEIYLTNRKRFDYAQIQYRRALTLLQLANITGEDKPNLLIEVLNAVDEAQQSLLSEDNPREWALLKCTRAMALIQLGQPDKESLTTTLSNVLTLLEGVTDKLLLEQFPSLYGLFLAHQAAVLLYTAALSLDDEVSLQQALEKTNAALPLLSPEQDSLGYAYTNLVRAMIMLQLALINEFEMDVQMPAVLSACDEALCIFRPEVDLHTHALAQNYRALALYLDIQFKGLNASLTDGMAAISVAIQYLKSESNRFEYGRASLVQALLLEAQASTAQKHHENLQKALNAAGVAAILFDSEIIPTDFIIAQLLRAQILIKMVDISQSASRWLNAGLDFVIDLQPLLERQKSPRRIFTMLTLQAQLLYALAAAEHDASGDLLRRGLDASSEAYALTNAVPHRQAIVFIGHHIDLLIALADQYPKDRQGYLREGIRVAWEAVQRSEHSQQVSLIHQARDYFLHIHAACAEDFTAIWQSLNLGPIPLWLEEPLPSIQLMKAQYISRRVQQLQSIQENVATSLPDPTYEILQLIDEAVSLLANETSTSEYALLHLLKATEMKRVATFPKENRRKRLLEALTAAWESFSVAERLSEITLLQQSRDLLIATRPLIGDDFDIIWQRLTSLSWQSWLGRVRQ